MFRLPIMELFLGSLHRHVHVQDCNVKFSLRNKMPKKVEVRRESEQPRPRQNLACRVSARFLSNHTFSKSTATDSNNLCNVSLSLLKSGRHFMESIFCTRVSRSPRAKRTISRIDVRPASCSLAMSSASV